MDTQVIVVGAGPVGLLLAGELRLGGATVVVVDRLATPMAESRASTLHARTMEIFDERGLLATLGSPPQEQMGHFGGLPLDLGAVPSRYPGQWKVPQAQVEALLTQWALGLGAELRRGHELHDLTVEPDRVRARLVGPTGPVTLDSEYLVGCDGESSPVRRLAGIAFPGTAATRTLLRADVAGIDIPGRRFARLPRGMAVAARRPDGVTRVMVAEFSPPARPGAAAPTYQDVCRVWQRVTGEDISAGVPLWVNAFGNACRQAEQYRRGRVLLAGDAAHQQLPAGGQAINLGLQDAVNLGWKLAAHLAGHACAELLDTYHTERHAVGARVLRTVAAQSTLLLGDSAVEPLRGVWAGLIAHPPVRDHLAATIAGLDVRYDCGSFPDCGPFPVVGGRMPDLPVVAGQGAMTRLAALLRGGRSVLLDASAEPERRRWLAEAVAGWRRWLELAVAAEPAAVQLDGAETVLVRPDGYVAWGGAGQADPRPALRRWVGRPVD